MNNNLNTTFKKELDKVQTAFLNHNIIQKKKINFEHTIVGKVYSFKIMVAENNSTQVNSNEIWLCYYNTSQFKNEGVWDNEIDKIWDVIFYVENNQPYWIKKNHLDSKMDIPVKMSTEEFVSFVIDKFKELNNE